MIKRLLLSAALLLLLLIPASVVAQEKISLVDSTVDVFFPQALVFNIKVESPNNITKVRLHYQVDRLNYAEVTSEAWLKFTPAPKVATKWAWDMRKAPLPTGATIKYWWTAEDAAGNKLKTSSQTFQFNDLRYQWQSLTAEQLNLFWYEGSRSFAEELLTTCQQAVKRLATDIGARPEKPVNLYIYANLKDLQGAMIFPREWTGGAAFPEYSIITLGISQRQLDWGKRALAHELAHLIVHQVTFSPYGVSLPTWLSEGLAMYAEGEPDPDLQAWLKKAVTEGKLLSVRSLSSPFSAKTEEAYISYAQSDSIVRFLIQNYGKDNMLQLLNLFKEGNTYDEALTKAYGFDTEGLDALWRTYITSKLQPKTTSFANSVSKLTVLTLPLPVPEYAH